MNLLKIQLHNILKTVLIISPHFPPINGADMHRVRQSVWYFQDFGWKPIVISVHENFVESSIDLLLLDSVPLNCRIEKVQAFSSKWTRKIGLGALALRSLFYYYIKIKKLVKTEKIDLIYFSTTQFPVLVLGTLFKKKYHIPFIIDMQDPWYSTYYLDKPKNQRPQKFWFSFFMNKILEPIAMKDCNGLISVSDDYITTLTSRYKNLLKVPSKTITFGAFEKDIEIAQKLTIEHECLKNEGKFPIIYVGRGGFDMQKAIAIIFGVFKRGIIEYPKIFKQFYFIFLGTSYAPNGKGIKTIEPLAEKMGIAEYVNEYTDRMPYFNGLNLLTKASLLLAIGSDDPSYTASKLYPYVLIKKPFYGIFHPKSSAVKILKDLNAGVVNTFDDEMDSIYNDFKKTIIEILNSTFNVLTDWNRFESYSARSMTKQQVEIFNKVLDIR